ncbi:MAG: hypothetical protein CM15mV40_020 [Caudoviricetes sp.]|nr:MAG: hypothetical protein CM15mV40_020 [Caudoviricetes sp.]
MKIPFFAGLSVFFGGGRPKAKRGRLSGAPGEAALWAPIGNRCCPRLQRFRQGETMLFPVQGNGVNLLVEKIPRQTRPRDPEKPNAKN